MKSFVCPHLLALVFWLSACGLVSGDEKGAVASNAAISTIRAAKLQWQQKITVEAYENVGSRSPKWDVEAREALNKWAMLRTGTLADVKENWDIVKQGFSKAKAVGCDDPLVAYAAHRCAVGRLPPIERVQPDVTRKLAKDLQASHYHPWLKFYAHLRAALDLPLLARKDTNIWPVFIGHFQQAKSNLWLTVHEGAAPMEEVYVGYRELLYSVKTHKSMVESFWTEVEPELFQRYPNHYLPWRLKAEHAVTMAWAARGSGFADTVSEDAGEKFEKHLKAGEVAVQEAWKLNPKDEQIALTAMSIELGLGQGRDVMEKWFQRAMALNPANTEACLKKLYYLEPKWHGSREEMLEFGRQCLESRVWTGGVVLMLVEAHDRLLHNLDGSNERIKYWRRPDVWRDVRESYELFLSRYPEDVDARTAFAQYADKANAFVVFLQQVEVLESSRKIDYAKFGGKPQLDRDKRRIQELKKAAERK